MVEAVTGISYRVHSMASLLLIYEHKLGCQHFISETNANVDGTRHAFYSESPSMVKRRRRIDSLVGKSARKVAYRHIISCYDAICDCNIIAFLN